MSGRSPGARRVRRYPDDELVAAVAGSRSWRAVLRTLGLAGTSAASIRSVRSQADRLGLDYSHFTGGRRWTDADLAIAVASARSWAEVARRLGLTSGSSESSLPGHAKRLDLETAHLRPQREDAGADRQWPAADATNLSRAGSQLAGAWFALRGWDVAWPLEPCRYDLLVSRAERVLRIQVKTATVRVGDGWTVWLSKARKARIAYGPHEVDYFFVVDGSFRYYLLPLAAVGGRHQIHLAAYDAYRVESR